MKKLFAVLVLALLPFSAFANDIDVTVNGMVCDFCAQSLKKEFQKEKGVESVDISLTKKLVRLHMKEGTEISDAAIRKHVEWGGYEVAKITRPVKTNKSNKNK